MALLSDIFFLRTTQITISQMFVNFLSPPSTRYHHSYGLSSCPVLLIQEKMSIINCIDTVALIANCVVIWHIAVWDDISTSDLLNGCRYAFFTFVLDVVVVILEILSLAGFPLTLNI